MTRKNNYEDVFKSIDIRGPDECWPWRGRIDRKGIPYFIVDGQKIVAYRLVKWLTDKNFNLLDERSVPMHQCKDSEGKAIDNPLCCNPTHTIIGTHEENMIDMLLKGRSGLTRDIIRDILSIREEFPELTQGQIAARIEYKHKSKVSRQAVTDILNGARHKLLVQKIREEDAKLGDANGNGKQSS